MIPIQGRLFKTITDLVFTPTPKARDLWAIGDYDNLQNTFTELSDVLVKAAYEGKTISVYTHGIYIKELFEQLRKLWLYDFAVVTHNSDVSADDSFQIPKNVHHWFAQNVGTDDYRIESIPIGLENNMWGLYHTKPPVNKVEMIKAKMGEEKNYRNLVYMNFNPATAPVKRNHVWNMFKDKSWVTAHRGSNFSDFGNYIDNVKNHKFVLCPEGNGMDTHRTWETLYLGNIPIEKRNKNNRFYTDLPILFVDEWEEVTEELLRRAYWTIKVQDWNMEKLDFDYWVKKIRSC
jgi:hypothetical protein